MSNTTPFGVIVPWRHVEAPYPGKDEENVFYSKIFDAQNVQEIVVFLTGALSSDFGAEVLLGFQGQDDVVMKWIFLGYIADNKPSEIFKVNFNQRASYFGAGDCQNSSSLHTSNNALLRITVGPLTELEQKVGEQEQVSQQDCQDCLRHFKAQISHFIYQYLNTKQPVTFFENFNSLSPSKSIFKKISDLPMYVPMKILNVEPALSDRPDSKGKIFALLGKDEVNFNLPKEDHKKMLDTNAYFFIQSCIKNSKNPFCFCYLHKTGKTYGFGLLPHELKFLDKASAKKPLTRNEIPSEILKEVEVDLLCKDVSQI